MTLASSTADFAASESDPLGQSYALSERASSRQYESTFNRLVDTLESHVAHQNGHHFTVSLTGEESQFTRFNSAKVRQSGRVCDGQMRLTLMTSERTTTMTIPFTGDFEADWALTQDAIAQLRSDLPQLPVDPYVVLPKAERPAGEQPEKGQSKKGQSKKDQSREVRSGQLLDAQSVAKTLIEPANDLDFSGLYAGGICYRAYGDSAGRRHWFETPSFTLDYSLFSQSTSQSDSQSAQQAVKGALAGTTWNAQDYHQSITATRQQLALLEKPAKKIPKGAYRTYLAPAAVADLIDTIIWGGGLGEAALHQGDSAFDKLVTGEAKLSDKFSLSEDFERVSVPRFNSNGAIAPTHLPIIQNGQWKNSLVNARSAKEYGKASNAANAEEAMRAPIVAPGTLPEDKILARLDTGLYISNLHYLNWSDLNAGGITGMTRYACFWVENGELVAPIENLRFDDNLYRFLGDGLIDLTEQLAFLPAVDTYDHRSLGGMWMPGMLIDQFRYTL